MVAVRARSGIGVSLLYAVNKPHEKIQLQASLLQRLSTSEYIATVQFIMPSPLSLY
jgi:hypothetical protein